MTGRRPRRQRRRHADPSRPGAKRSVSTSGESRTIRPAAAADRHPLISRRQYSLTYVITSTPAPILRSTPRAPGVLDHQTSWPWVRATRRPTPACRSPGASSPNGAAAPNTTRSQPCSRASDLATPATRAVGSKTRERSRTTGYVRPASSSAAPGILAVYTTGAESDSHKEKTKDSMPPRRGGKSFVMTRTLLAGFVIGPRAGAPRPMPSRSGQAAEGGC